MKPDKKPKVLGSMKSGHFGDEVHVGKFHHYYLIIECSNLSCRKETTNSIARKIRTRRDMIEPC